MTTDIKELVKRLREGKFARLQIAGPYPDQYVYAVDTEKTHLRAADALEAMAGEVERLTIQRDAEHQKYLKTYDLMGSESHRAEAAEAERDRLKAALVKIEERAWSISFADDIVALARKALGGDAS